MVLSVGERVKGFLFSPSETFDRSKEDTLGDAFKYFVVILAVFAAILAVLVAVAFSLYAGMFGMLGAPRMAFGTAVAGPLLALVFFVCTLVVWTFSVFISGLWLHLWVFLVGGRNGVEQTLKAVIYGETPSLLLGWIPVLGVVAAIWTLVVEAVGVRQLHELSTGRAVLAVVLAVVIPAVVLVALFAAFIATEPGGIFPGLGPGGPGPRGPRFFGF
ncbi:MAG: YIP1 family protein [Candidatus Methanospirareceae archaeon]